MPNAWFGTMVGNPFPPFSKRPSAAPLLDTNQFDWSKFDSDKFNTCIINYIIFY